MAYLLIGRGSGAVAHFAGSCRFENLGYDLDELVVLAPEPPHVVEARLQLLVNRIELPVHSHRLVSLLLHYLAQNDCKKIPGVRADSSSVFDDKGEKK